VGCEDYCTTKLPKADCKEEHEEWTANVAHIFQALDYRARMCQATGLNGCPNVPTPQPRQVPIDPYPYTAADKGSESDTVPLLKNRTRESASAEVGGTDHTFATRAQGSDSRVTPLDSNATALEAIAQAGSAQGPPR
jgi:hypothetical protein